MKSLRLVTISAIFAAVLAGVLLMSSPAPVQGYGEAITIEPAAPTEEDFVRVGLEGWYEYRSTSMGCGDYWVPQSASHSLSGQTITIEEVWTLDPGPGGMCEASGSWELPYGFTFDVGPLAAGEYTVEVYSDEYGGPPYLAATALFTVAPDNCPSLPNPEQADANGNGLGDACDPADSDGDGFSDRLEYSAGTSRTSGCGVNAWPADIDNSGSVDVIGDIAPLAGAFGQSVPPAAARYDIAPDSPDGVIDVIGDLSRVAGLFGLRCFSPSSAPPLPPEAYSGWSAEDCSDWWWHDQARRWEADCGAYFPAEDWGYWDYYYWDPDSQTAVLYRTCSGGVMSTSCCGTGGGMCDMARAAFGRLALYL